MGDNIRIPAHEGTAEFLERHSRFIGWVKPVPDEAAALSFLNGIREKHRDATHNVYAYILREGGISRHSDDGEPQGTAGLPVLEVFRREEIFDVCCVVTRYFGGILLGAGGLVRAYARAAKEALDAAGVAVLRRCTKLRLSCPYPLWEQVRLLAGALEGKEEAIDYAEEVFYTFWLISPAVPELQARLSELSSGRLRVEIADERLRAL